MDEDDDPVILRFFDSSLRLSDYQLLAGPHWLSDQLIGFFFEYLHRVVCPHSTQPRVAFLCPEVAQLVKLSPPDQAIHLLAPLDLHTAQLLFLPVNDAYDPASEGGTHWSLLMFSRATGAFYHYDSCRGYNSDHARVLCRHLAAALGYHSPQEAALMEPPCQQQTNSYDCGVHVVANAQCMVNKLVLGGQDGQWNDKSPAEVRAWLRRLICRLAQSDVGYLDG